MVADADEGLGIGYREVVEHDGIDQGEDGGVGSDAEGQREQHGCGEARGFAQLAECVTQILNEYPHGTTSRDTLACEGRSIWRATGRGWYVVERRRLAIWGMRGCVRYWDWVFGIGRRGDSGQFVLGRGGGRGLVGD